MKKSNLRKEKRRLNMEALRLRMMNVARFGTFYQMQDVSGFSVPALDGSMKTVLRTVQ